MVQFADVPELENTPLIIDLIDVDSQKWFDYAAAANGLKRAVFALEGRRLRRFECSLPQRASGIILVSQAEADLYLGFCPNDKTMALHNGVDLDYFTHQPPTPEPQPNQCVFVGVLDYRANVESLVWFCHEVWPRVLARKPNAIFAIVGKSPAPAVKRLASETGVRLVGCVPDVRPYVAESRFAVAPLQIARGIQNKVLEAMAMGRPVLASPQALEGFGVKPGQEVLSAVSPAEWADAMLQLFTDDSLASALGSRARKFVQDHHGWSACLTPLDDILGLAVVPHVSAPTSPALSECTLACSNRG
jgi:sugar transferase (PEP-CTERM/EpsH1 system associated)